MKKQRTEKPVYLREQKQIRQTKFFLAAAGLIIAAAAVRLIFDFSPVCAAVLALSAVIYAVSFSSLLSGEWTIGMIPPAGLAVFTALTAAGWKRLTAPESVYDFVLLGVVALLGLFVLIFAVVSLLMLGASLRTAKRSDDTTLLVLGTRLKNGKPGALLMRRLLRAEKYLTAHPDCKCILTGGKIHDEPCAEAEAMLEYLTVAGIDSSRLFAETKSTTTYENIRFSRVIAEKNGLAPRFAVVTDRFHQYRAQLICRDNGIEARAVNVRTPLHLLPQYWSREILCIFEKIIKKL